MLQSQALLLFEHLAYLTQQCQTKYGICMHIHIIIFISTFYPQHHSSKGIPFYTNSVGIILKRCLGNPTISSSVARYPTMPNSYIRYYNNFACASCKTYFLMNCREIFYGRRWREDPRFHAPMVCLPFGNVYIRDFVNFSCNGRVLLGRVSQFLHKVSAT